MSPDTFLNKKLAEIERFTAIIKKLEKFCNQNDYKNFKKEFDKYTAIDLTILNFNSQITLTIRYCLEIPDYQYFVFDCTDKNKYLKELEKLKTGIQNIENQKLASNSSALLAQLKDLAKLF